MKNIRTENAFYKLDKDLSISVKYSDDKILIFPLELNFKPADKRNTHLDVAIYHSYEPVEFDQLDDARKYLKSLIKTYKQYKEIIKFQKATEDFQ